MVLLVLKTLVRPKYTSFICGGLWSPCIVVSVGATTQDGVPSGPHTDFSKGTNQDNVGTNGWSEYLSAISEVDRVAVWGWIEDIDTLLVLVRDTRASLVSEG